MLLMLSSHAQSLEVGIGLGLGAVYNPKADLPGTAKGLVFLEARHALSESFSIGLELGSAGNLNPLAGDLETPEPGGQITISPSLVQSSTYLAKGIYFFPTKARGYVALGLGLNTFSRFVHLEDIDRIRRRNFAFQPEFGFQIGGFIISYKHLFGGKTPGLDVTSSQGQTTRMVSTNVNFSLLSFGYLAKF